MRAALPTRPLVAVAAVVLAIGAERLLSAHWMGRAFVLSSTRFVVAAFCLVLGASLLALLVFDRTLRRRP